MQWWEKTVEYKFVVDAFREGKCEFATPLSGKQERLAGDAVFGSQSLLVLIEFKRNKTEIPTERSLFHDYEKAQEELSNYDHHHIVFGVQSQNSLGTLELAAQTYFSGRPRTSALDSLRFGINGERFRQYVEALARLKKEDGRSTSGHISPEALSSVMSISKDGEILAAMPLYEYAPDLFLADHPDETPPPTQRNAP